MNTRMMAFMGCRILAMYWLYCSSGEVSRALRSIRDSQGNFPEMTFGMGVYVALLPIFLAISAVLWFGTGWLSDIVARGTSSRLLPCHPEAIATGAAVATGLMLSVFSLRTLLHYLLPPNGQSIPWIDTLAPAVALTCSIVLLINARRAFLLRGETHGN